MSPLGAFPDTIHTAPHFVVRRERVYSFAGAQATERVAIYPRRRRAWTDGALRAALAWYLVQCTTGIVIVGPNVREVIGRVAPDMLGDPAVQA